MRLVAACYDELDPWSGVCNMCKKASNGVVLIAFVERIDDEDDGLGQHGVFRFGEWLLENMIKVRDEAVVSKDLAVD